MQVPWQLLHLWMDEAVLVVFRFVSACPGSAVDMLEATQQGAELV